MRGAFRTLGVALARRGHVGETDVEAQVHVPVPPGDHHEDDDDLRPRRVRRRQGPGALGQLQRQAGRRVRRQHLEEGSSQHPMFPRTVDPLPRRNHRARIVRNVRRLQMAMRVVARDRVAVHLAELCGRVVVRLRLDRVVRGRGVVEVIEVPVDVFVAVALFQEDDEQHRGEQPPEPRQQQPEEAPAEHLLPPPARALRRDRERRDVQREKDRADLRRRQAVEIEEGDAREAIARRLREGDHSLHELVRLVAEDAVCVPLLPREGQELEQHDEHPRHEQVRRVGADEEPRVVVHRLLGAEDEREPLKHLVPRQAPVGHLPRDVVIGHHAQVLQAGV
mmetsp:Transcript_48128/g.148536  ORF Transcript_48128/g.148536 Transcript_48128/m.148536 type:complete len:336 (+) Transcript_48128:707-1714(+)